jgi:hypothetical protein
MDPTPALAADVEQLHGLERLGDSDAFGEQLVRLLEIAGWEVERTRAFAGEGLLVIARKGPFELKATGPTLAAAIPDVFEKAMQLRVIAAVGTVDRQMELF